MGNIYLELTRKDEEKLPNIERGFYVIDPYNYVISNTLFSQIYIPISYGKLLVVNISEIPIRDIENDLNKRKIELKKYIYEEILPKVEIQYNY